MRVDKATAGVVRCDRRKNLGGDCIYGDNESVCVSGTVCYSGAGL